MKKLTIDLATAMTIVSNKRFISTEKVFEILNFLTCDLDYSSKEISKVFEEAKKQLVSNYPELEGIADDVIINNEEECAKFITDLTKVFGNSFTISPVVKETFEETNPIIKTQDMEYGKN